MVQRTKYDGFTEETYQLVEDNNTNIDAGKIYNMTLTWQLTTTVYTSCALNDHPLLSYTLSATLCYQRLLSCIAAGTAAKTQLAPQMHTVLISLVEPRQDTWLGEDISGHLSDYLRDKFNIYLINRSLTCGSVKLRGPLSLPW